MSRRYHCLVKLDVDNHIKLKIAEIDIKSLFIRKDTTYPEIKDYVLKKYVLRSLVSTLHK